MLGTVQFCNYFYIVICKLSFMVEYFHVLKLFEIIFYFYLFIYFFNHTLEVVYYTFIFHIFFVHPVSMFSLKSISRYIHLLVMILF